MAVMELVATAAAAAAAALAVGPGGDDAERRLAVLLPPAPRERRQRHGVSPATRLLVALTPVLTLTLLLGPTAGIPSGLAACGFVWWRLGRPDPAAARARHRAIDARLPVAADLLVVALRAGCGMTGALDSVARALGGPLGGELRAVAERLRLGADPGEAWRRAAGPPELAALGRLLARADRTGAPVADVLDRFAMDRRRAARARALALAQRTGVMVVAPLGLCFLPAFFLIGIVPLAAGLLSGLAPP